MYNAELYQQNNAQARRDVKDLMEEFSSIIKWREDGQDTLLDVGCGPGDITIDFVLPKMPKNFKKLVGSDISEEMLQYGRKFYDRPNVSFEQLDIAGDARKFLDNHPGGFDHITSFYCLHWVQKQDKALKNIYDLLNSTGDCVLQILAYHPYFTTYKELARYEKWSKFMENSDSAISPFQNVTNRSAAYSDLLKKAGFSKFDIQEVDKVYIYDDLSIFKRLQMSVNPSYANMTKEQAEEYFEDFLDLFVEKGIVQREENGKSFRVKLEYKLLIVYANK